MSDHLRSTIDQANALSAAAKAVGLSVDEYKRRLASPPAPEASAPPTPRQLSRMSMKELGDYERQNPGAIDAVLVATSEAEEAATPAAQFRAAQIEREEARVAALEADEAGAILAQSRRRFAAEAPSMTADRRVALARELGVDPVTLDVEQKGS